MTLTAATELLRYVVWAGISYSRSTCVYEMWRLAESPLEARDRLVHTDGGHSSEIFVFRASSPSPFISVRVALPWVLRLTITTVY